MLLVNLVEFWGGGGLIIENDYFFFKGCVNI